MGEFGCGGAQPALLAPLRDAAKPVAIDVRMLGSSIQPA